MELKKIWRSIFGQRKKPEFPKVRRLPMTDDARLRFHRLMASSLNESIHSNEPDVKKPDEVWFLQGGADTAAMHEDEDDPTITDVADEISVGGSITLSADITPKLRQGTKLIDRIKNVFSKIVPGAKTQRARWQRYDRIENVITGVTRQRGMSETGFTVGPFAKGVYYDAAQGATFNEKSLCIEFYGVDSIFLKKSAQELRKVFDQNSVLVHDREQNKAYFLHAPERSTA